jgi:crotonobetainyl-CoA:carnitine CoA-transferase CaiB-like acyl-CoA transferase
VLSFGSYLAGNAAAMVLAELGADVVKIESHVRPETLRVQLYPEQPPAVEPSGMSTTSLFCGLARSVRSFAMEMTNPHSVELFKRLAAVSDAVVENFGPDVMAGWGLSFDDLHGVNPRLVMLSISGYGRTGPMAAHRAFASTVSHHTGLTRAWDGNVALQHFDWSAAMQGVVAVLAGVAQSRSTGHGIHVDLAQAEAGAGLMAPVYLDIQAEGDDFHPRGNDVADSLLSGIYRCTGGDDRWVAIELEDLADWNEACELVEAPELRLDTSDAVAELRPALDASIAAWTSWHTPMQAAVVFQHHGLAAGPVQDGEDLYRDPQLRHRRFIVAVDHPDLGTVEYPDAPHRADVEPARVRRHGPRLGQHTVDVLTDWLRLDAAAIDDLIASGTAWSPSSAHPSVGASPPSSSPEHSGARATT